MEEILYAYRLSSLDGIGNQTHRALLEYTGSYEDIPKLSADEIRQAAPGIRDEQIRLITAEWDEDAIKASYNEMLGHGISFYHYKHPAYPAKLRCIYDPPAGIYVRGRLPDPEVMSIAIVGARNCSEYGRYVTRKLATSLSGAGIQIISGLARGIDGIAQKAALDAGGYSCGVLGCGVDICYPAENRETYDRLIGSGGLVSEYHPGVGPISGQFPLRNRIISALSDIVIIVEARDRSGSLITADLALDQGKDVYALPGRVTDSLSHGCNRLIKQGAGIIISPEEFLKDLQAVYQCSQQDTDGQQMTLTACLDLTSEEKAVLTAMDYNTPKSIKILQDETSLAPARLYICLTKLTLKGLILQKGSQYVLSGG